jgi:lipopolysaccharide/colanic/teichoic acid biosynthesis glycosyltransferase/glycosyltransferase involved in cell wall biosynthesis
MYSRLIKRPIDLIFSLLAIIVLSPVILIVALFVKVKLGSPVIFKQKRPGLNEKIFTIYKFRTMIDEKNQYGELLPDSARLTNLGKLLRSTSLDELPELFNILKGDMSIVGPRPQLIRDMVFMTPEQRKRHSVLPGLTGWAQVNGRNGITWEEKLSLDLQYVNDITFFNDWKIIFMTIVKVIKKDGISAEGMDTAEDLGDYLLRAGTIEQSEYIAGQEESKLLISSSSDNKLKGVRTMYKAGICGCLAYGIDNHGGQIVKTRTFAEELKNEFDEQSIQIVDTYGWKKNPVLLFIKCSLLIKNCKNIIIMPAENGLKVFVPLFLLFNKVFHRKLHYVVIGGWLPELLESNYKLINKLNSFDGIYVETNIMVEKLKLLGLKNVIYLPNFKRLEILEESELVYPTEEPYKLCTFSRVMKEKGIEDAIDVVNSVNDFFGRTAYTLDIYGQIDDNYIERFEILKKEFPKYISYKGVVKSNDSVYVLKSYFALMFPTYYEGEGFAGTILDSYAAGIPAIATDWKYNREIIHENSDGLIYDYQNKDMLKKILIEIYQNPNVIFNMKKNCLNRATEYLPETVINNFISYLR